MCGHYIDDINTDTYLPSGKEERGLASPFFVQSPKNGPDSPTESS